MKIEDIKALEALPPSTMCRLIAFDRAQVVPGFIPKTFFLIVSGEKPWASMEVELVPFGFRSEARLLGYRGNRLSKRDWASREGSLLRRAGNHSLPQQARNRGHRANQKEKIKVP